jgi:hypothetical protein
MFPGLPGRDPVINLCSCVAASRYSAELLSVRTYTLTFDSPNSRMLIFANSGRALSTFPKVRGKLTSIELTPTASRSGEPLLRIAPATRLASRLVNLATAGGDRSVRLAAR